MQSQFVIGNNLESCRQALVSDDGDNLHLLERINIDLQVQNSIVPTAYSLARFKVAGSLPSLSVNLSDTKYKSLMKLIDVCIPKFDDDSDTAAAAVVAPAPPPANRNPSGAFQGLFGQKGEDYTVPLDEDDGEKAENTPKSDVFFPAPDGNAEVCHEPLWVKHRLTELHSDLSCDNTSLN